MISAGPNMAEARPTQSDYASAASEAFAPRQQEDRPNVVLVEAGTGVGKTLGYVAPASLWAEKNGAPVWIATYTRNLQRQIDNELDRLHRDSAEKRRRVVIRKGRENYLCLLNFQEAVQPHGPHARERCRPRPAGALGAGQPRRRHDRRRPALLAARPPGPRPHHASRRPPGRVHLLGVRALPEVLRRAHHPPRTPGRHRDRQPRAGHGAGRDGRARRFDAAAALRVRRGPSSVRRRRRCVRRASQRHGDVRPQALDPRRRGTARQPGARARAARHRSAGRRCRGTECAAPPARPHAQAALDQLADPRRRRHGDGSGRGVPRSRAPAGARARHGRRRGLRPGMRRAAAQSRAARGGRSAGATVRSDAGAGAPAPPRAQDQARDRGRQARQRPTRPHRGRDALARQPLRAHARGVEGDAEGPAQRARSHLRRLVRDRAQPEPRDRHRHVPALSRSRPSRS